MFIPVTMYKSAKYAFYGKKCPENRRGFFMRSFGCTRKVYNLYVDHYRNELDRAGYTGGKNRPVSSFPKSVCSKRTIHT